MTSRISLNWIAIGLPLTLACAPAHTRTPTADIAIAHVAVVDVEAGRILTDRTVLISGDRIVTIDSSRRSAARVVDGAGKYLMPGLWDMHVHALRNARAPRMFPLFVATGVLGIRDTGSPLDSLVYYRREVASGRLVGPRVIGSGPLLDGPHGQWPDFTVSITSPAEARRAVDSLAEGGADFVKVYDRLPRDAYFAVARRARERRMPIAGHVPEAVTPVEASDSGMRSIEHLTVAPSCIPRMLSLIQQYMSYGRPGLSADSMANLGRELSLHIEAAYDESACRSAGARLARNGTWLDPTLGRERTWSRAYLAGHEAGADSNLRLVPAAVRGNWSRWRDSIVASRSPKDELEEANRYQLYLRIVRALRAAGVGILAGTDTDENDAYFYGVPGYTLHTELETFVSDLGFTPAEALRTATIDAARFLGVADSIGTVAPGKRAELVLVDANPLDDVRNARRVRAVVRGGRLLDRAALDSMLAKLAASVK